MKNQRNNYYVSRKSKLLKSFDKTANLVRDSVVSRYGADFSNTVLREARQEFEALIPGIPYAGSDSPPALRLFPVWAAMELAVYKAMKKHGKSAAEAWELCHEAIKIRVERVPKLVRRIAKFYLFSNFIKKRARKVTEKSQKQPFGDWAFKYVEGDGKNFDWGVDYTGCSIYIFMCEQGGEEFAPFVCMSDITLSDALEWGLIRTQTIADGYETCDFRFKKGSKTRISSKTPEVQATIEATKPR